MTGAEIVDQAALFGEGDGYCGTESDCVASQNVEKKVVGPALKSVAAKYAGDATAQARLVARIRSGGKGVRGSTAMPPAPKKVSDEDLNTLVSWILSLK